jgi:hypothetical protein
MDAPVDAELLRYSADVQLADAVALVAERVVELGRRVEVLEAAKKPRPKPKPKTAAEE